jgi:hypothetical protein
MEATKTDSILLVVYVGGRAILCSYPIPFAMSRSTAEMKVVTDPVICVSDPVEILTQHMSRPGPGGVELLKQVVPLPLGEALYDFSMWVKPEAIIVVDTLKASDQERYKKLGEDARLHRQTLQAKTAGIEIVSSLNG